MSSPRTIVDDVPVARLERLRALQHAVAERERRRFDAIRADLLRECPHPLALAMHLDPSIRSTPAIDLISHRWVETLHAHDGRMTTSLGPQQGKTVCARWLVFWALLEDPDRRVVYASFAMGLARQSGREIRNLVNLYGDPYGLRMDRAHHDAADWQLDGYRGGVFCAGAGQPGSRLTGQPADLMMLDDLLSGEGEAHSEASRTAVETWWESTARVRMRPGAAAISIGTRWSEDDILSRFIAEGWDRINIPAIADGETLDSVADLPGARTSRGYLVSTRGSTEADWDAKRREMGERAWHALEQGNPSPPEGGIFQRSWFATHRVPTAPPLELVAIMVDPADTGTGDAAGMLAMARTKDARIAVLADLSGQYSQAEWGREACLGWMRWGAARIVQEHNLGMRTTIPDAWAIIYRQAMALAAAATNGHGDEDRVTEALASLRVAGDLPAANERQLRGLLAVYGDVLDRGPTGPRVVSVTPKQSKRVRAESVAAAFETGRAFLVGEHRELEFEATTWAEGAPSPNRLDTLAMGAAHLEQAVGAASIARKPSRGRQRVPGPGIRPGWG